MADRGVLTDDDRAFFRGERDDIDDEDKTRREKVFHIRQRIDNLDDDIDILRKAGEEETVQYLYQVVGRFERLERRLDELEQQVGGHNDGEDITSSSEER